jgi:hypothetical protein
MAPDDKERVLRALKERDFFTLMCGDGANDGNVTFADLLTVDTELNGFLLRVH